MASAVQEQESGSYLRTLIGCCQLPDISRVLPAAFGAISTTVSNGKRPSFRIFIYDAECQVHVELPFSLETFPISEKASWTWHVASTDGQVPRCLIAGIGVMVVQ